MLARTLALTLALALLALPSFAQDKGKDKPKDAAKDAAKDGKKDDKKDTKGSKAEPFDFPLKVGTTWIYRVAENRYFLRVAKMETVGKQECARVEMRIGDKVVSFEHLASAKVPAGSDQEGAPAILRFSFEGKEATPPIPLLLLDGKKAWSINSKLDGKELKGVFRKEYVSSDDPKKPAVRVPAGEYKSAIKVYADNLKVNGVDLSITYWFVSGVGMVKQEAEMAGQKVIIELETMTPGK